MGLIEKSKNSNGPTASESALSFVEILGKSLPIDAEGDVSPA